MGKTSNIISIPVKADVEGAISQLLSDFKNIGNLGLDEEIRKEVKNAEKEVKNLGKAFNSYANQKVDTKQFDKAQANLLSRVEAVEKETSVLKNSLTSLMTTLSKTGDTAFSKELNKILEGMQKLNTVTNQVTDSFNQVGSNTKKPSIDTVLKQLQGASKALKDIQNDLKSTEIRTKDIINVTDFEQAAQDYIDLIEKIRSTRNKLNEYSKKETLTGSDITNIINLEKELSAAQKEFNGLYKGLEKDYDRKFTGLKNKSNEYVKNLQSEVEQIFKDSAKQINTYLENIAKQQNELQQKIGANTNKNTNTKKKTKNEEMNLTKEEEEALRPDMKISTKPSTLLTDATKIINYVNENLKDKPIEAEVVLTTEWGTRKHNELLKKFQQQIDGLNNKSTKKEFQETIDEISRSFGNEIDLKFNSNFKDELDTVKTQIDAIRQDLQTSIKFKVNPQLDEKGTNKLQKQLDAIAKKLVLTINNIEIGEEALNKAQKKTGQDK